MGAGPGSPVPAGRRPGAGVSDRPPDLAPGRGGPYALQERLGPVDPDLGAGDVVRGVGGEEQHKPCHLIGRAGLAAGEGTFPSGNSTG